MIREISDFRQVVCIAAEGELYAKGQTSPDELNRRLVRVKVDFRGDLVFLQQLRCGLKQLRRSGPSVAPEDTERVGQHTNVAFEHLAREEQESIVVGLPWGSIFRESGQIMEGA